MQRLLLPFCLILLLNSCSQFTLKYKRDLNHKTVEAVYNGTKANQPILVKIADNIQETERVIDRKWLLPADRQKAEAYLANLIKLQSLLQYQNPDTLPTGKDYNLDSCGSFTKFVMDLNISQEIKIAGLSEQQLKLRLLELKAEFEYLQRRLK